MKANIYECSVKPQFIGVMEFNPSWTDLKIANELVDNGFMTPLDSDNPMADSYFKVEDNQLVMRDSDSNELVFIIEHNFSL